MEDCLISKSHLVLEHFAQSKTSLSFRQEEDYLRLKSRSLWLLEGDKNSAYFHRQCRARLSRNHISKISSGDRETIKGQALLKQDASTHFQLLFQEDGLSDGDVLAEFMENIPSLVSS